MGIKNLCSVKIFPTAQFQELMLSVRTVHFPSTELSEQFFHSFDLNFDLRAGQLLVIIVLFSEDRTLEILKQFRKEIR